MPNLEEVKVGNNVKMGTFCLPSSAKLKIIEIGSNFKATGRFFIKDTTIGNELPAGQYTTITVGDGGSFSSADAFSSVTFSKLKTLTFGKNTSLNGFKSAKLGTGLEDGVSCTVSVGAGSTVVESAFYGADMTRVSSITLTGVKSIGTKAFAEMATTETAPLDISASGVGNISRYAFGTRWLGTVTVGAASDESGYAYGYDSTGIFARVNTSVGVGEHNVAKQDATVNKLIVVGCIPTGSPKRALGNYYSKETDQSFLEIKELDLSACTLMSAEPFGINVTIDNATLDVSSLSYVPANFLYQTSLPNLTSISFTNGKTGEEEKTVKEFRSGAFNTELSKLTSLTIPAGADIKAGFYGMIAPKLQTLTIGEQSNLNWDGTSGAFQNAKIGTASETGVEVSVGQNSSFGKYAFKSTVIGNAASGKNLFTIGQNSTLAADSFPSVTFGNAASGWSVLTIGSGSTIGTSAFSSATFGNGTSGAPLLSIGAGCTIGTTAFQSAKFGTSGDSASKILIGSGSTIAEKAFYNADMTYVDSVTLTGCASIGEKAFGEMTTDADDPVDIDATEVGKISARCFTSADLGTVTVGVTDDITGYSFGGKNGNDANAGIFGRDSYGASAAASQHVRELKVVGKVPAASLDNALGTWYQQPNINCWLTIDSVDLSGCTQICSCPFGSGVTIGNSSLDFTASIFDDGIPSQFFRNTNFSNLESINIPANMTVGSYAFAGNTYSALTSISVGDGATVMDYAFSSDTFSSLATISIGSNVSVRDYAFSSNRFESLQSITVGSNSAIGTVTVKDNTSSYGTSVFASCTTPTLSTISFGDGVTTGEKLFDNLVVTDPEYHIITVSGLTGLKERDFGGIKVSSGLELRFRGTKEIVSGNWARWSSALNKVVFDGTLKQFSLNGQGLDNLTNITFQRFDTSSATNCITKGPSNIGDFNSTCRFHVSAASYGSYITDSSWASYKTRFVADTAILDNWGYIVLEGSADTGYKIALESYEGGDALSNNVLTVPASLTDGNGVTYTVTQIRSGLLESAACCKVTQLRVPASVTYIDPRVFDSRGFPLSISSVWIDANNQYYTTEGTTLTSGGYAGAYLLNRDKTYLYRVISKGLNGAEEIELNYKHISDSALTGCIGLKSVTIGSYVESLESGLFTFSGSNIKTWTFQSTTPPTLIGDDVFGDIIFTSAVLRNDGSGYYDVCYVGADGYHIYVPTEAAVNTYKSAQGFTWYAPIIEAVPAVTPQEDGLSLDGITPETDCWGFVANGTSITLTSYSGPATAVTIPTTMTINGTDYTVTAIGPGLFTNSEVTVVTIPAVLGSVDPAAFDGSKVERVELEGAGSLYSTAQNGAALLSADGKTLWRVMPAVKGELTLEGVASVATGALKGCSLESLALPGLGSVSEKALADWGAERSLKVYGTSVPQVLGVESFASRTLVVGEDGEESYVYGDSPTLHVTAGMAGAFRAQPGYENVSIVEDNVSYENTESVIINVEPSKKDTLVDEALAWSYYLQITDNGEIGAVLLSAPETGEEEELPTTLVLPAYVGAVEQKLDENGEVVTEAFDGYPVIGLDPDFDASMVSAFEVEEGSRLRTDWCGVLYTVAEEGEHPTLIRYPAGNTAVAYVVEEDAAIAERAFAGATNLRSVLLCPYALKNMGSNVFADTDDNLNVYAGKFIENILHGITADGVDTQSLRILHIIEEEEVIGNEDTAGGDSGDDDDEGSEDESASDEPEGDNEDEASGDASTEPETPVDEPTEDEPTEDEPTGDEPTGEVTPEEEPVEETPEVEPTEEEPAEEEPAEEEPAEVEPTVEEPVVVEPVVVETPEVETPVSSEMSLE